MLGPGHALSGAAAGYGACLATTAVSGYVFHPLAPHVVAVVTAGWALFPDCDTRRSTVSTSLGCVTAALHRGMITLAAAAYYATRTEADDPRKPLIHRGLSHTWPFALVIGALIGALCLAWPRWAAPAIAGLSLHWALRGLVIPAPRAAKSSNVIGRRLTEFGYRLMRLAPLPGKYVRGLGRGGSLALSLAIAFSLTERVHGLGVSWAVLLGSSAALGCLVHCLGDSVTEFGICWLYPFAHPRTGRRWQPIRFPKWLAFKAGRALETCVMWPLLFVGCLLAMPGGYPLIATFLSAAWRGGVNVALALPLLSWPRTTPALLPPSSSAAPPRPGDLPRRLGRPSPPDHGRWA